MDGSLRVPAHDRRQGTAHRRLACRLSTHKRAEAPRSVDESQQEQLPRLHIAYGASRLHTHGPRTPAVSRGRTAEAAVAHFRFDRAPTVQERNAAAPLTNAGVRF